MPVATWREAEVAATLWGVQQGELPGIRCVDLSKRTDAAERLGNYSGCCRLTEVNAAQVA